MAAVMKVRLDRRCLHEQVGGHSAKNDSNTKKSGGAPESMNALDEKRCNEDAASDRTDGHRYRAKAFKKIWRS